MKLFKMLSILSFFLLTVQIKAQDKIVDRVIAVIGDRYVLQSDIENQLIQMQAQNSKLPDNARCYILEELMVQKLLANQADLDSVVVAPTEVDLQLEQRIQYFINQIGSQEALEEYFGKSIVEIKEDMRGIIYEQLLTQRMQGQVVGDFEVTPSDVKAYYKNLPPDSIPYVNGSVEFSQIVLYPPYGEQSVLEVRQNLLNLRKRILEGESFTTLAVLYSQGPSSSKGGEIGFASRADLDPEYAKVAFSMKEGQVSKIVETDFGYHIIQMIERRDDRVNTRHILMRPKVSAEASEMALQKLDSIANAIQNDSITFEMAALIFSEDDKSKVSGGKAVNPNTGSHKWEMDHFRTQDYYIIKDLNEGEMSKPYESIDNNENKIYKLVRVTKKTPPHTANLKQDYNLFKQQAAQQKKAELFDEWLQEKIGKNFVTLKDDFTNCEFRFDGWIQ